LHGPDVKEFEVEIVRDLRDDLRLADAARAPDMQRHALPISAWSASYSLDGFIGFPRWCERDCIVVG